MKLRVVAVGALKSGAERELCDQYLRRIGRYCRIDEVELRAGKPPDEAAAIERACAGAMPVLCDERGLTLTSDQFARRLGDLAARGKGEIAFVIGGAHGLPGPLARRHDSLAGAERWTLSALTLPHRLARVVLCEQLYRALTILRGEPYHH